MSFDLLDLLNNCLYISVQWCELDKFQSLYKLF